MSHFIAYPVTPAMGLRQSIDAMLEHVAYARHDFGYLPDAVRQANHDGLVEDYGTILVDDGGVLILAPVIHDSQALASLVDALVGLCNDYPAYDDERVSQIEQSRLIDTCEESREDDMPDAEDIARAIWEIGAYVEQSEYGAWVSEEDFANAVAYARETYSAAATA